MAEGPKECVWCLLVESTHLKGWYRTHFPLGQAKLPEISFGPSDLSWYTQVFPKTIVLCHSVSKFDKIRCSTLKSTAVIALEAGL